ncbi:hypothetical protein NBRC3255_2954 [Gluconobacter thailandicus NBRC 3255]|nr:hypothetical protein NBRC3255_2954 [Gluconobacter thailandicus NBRC 3255]
MLTDLEQFPDIFQIFQKWNLYRFTIARHYFLYFNQGTGNSIQDFL